MKKDLVIKSELLKALEFMQSVFNAEVSFYEFFKQAWPTIEGEKPFIAGWHIEAICEHLEAVTNRQIKNLLINIPPRFGKSDLVSIAFPAWVWINSPHEKFMYASYAQSLSMRHSVDCRRLIDSNWYRSNWSNKFQLMKDQNTKSRFDNTAKGYRIATSVNGSVTGEGASILVVDDGNNTRFVESKVIRESVIEWWTKAWSTRLNDKKNDCRIVIQQRSHERDLTGYIMANDNLNEWEKLILPMEFEASRKCFTVLGSDPRKKEGELLWPEGIDTKALQSLKIDLGSQYAISGQLQQRPSPKEGGILKKEWFKHWSEPIYPTFERIVQSWDTAITDSPTSAYSACSTWGVFLDNTNIYNCILLSQWRGRVNYPELRARAIRLKKNYLDTQSKEADYKAIYNVDIVLIEAKATGDPLIRDLHLAGIRALPRQVKGDKESRVQRVSHFIESGLIWLPMDVKLEKLMPFADEFIEAISTFPNVESRDLVDSMTQTFEYLRDVSMLSHPANKEQQHKTQKYKKLY